MFKLIFGLFQLLLLVFRDHNRQVGTTGAIQLLLWLLMRGGRCCFHSQSWSLGVRSRAQLIVFWILIIVAAYYVFFENSLHGWTAVIEASDNWFRALEGLCSKLTIASRCVTELNSLRFFISDWCRPGRSLFLGCCYSLFHYIFIGRLGFWWPGRTMNDSFGIIDLSSYFLIFKFAIFCLYLLCLSL